MELASSNQSWFFPNLSPTSNTAPHSPHPAPAVLQPFDHSSSANPQIALLAQLHPSRAALKLVVHPCAKLFFSGFTLRQDILVWGCVTHDPREQGQRVCRTTQKKLHKCTPQFREAANDSTQTFHKAKYIHTFQSPAECFLSTNGTTIRAHLTCGLPHCASAASRPSRAPLWHYA